MKLPYYCDNKYSNWDTNYESSLASSVNSGEAQENAVIFFLWDLYDNSQGETFDNITLGSKSWWTYSTQKGTYTLTDFVKILEAKIPSYRSQIGAILSEYHIAPGNVSVLNSGALSTSVSPIVKWTINGSSYSPNNRFQVVIYDDYGNCLFISPYINVYQYTVPASSWKQVIKNYGGKFKIHMAVRGYNTTNFVSGPYISNYATASITINDSISIASSQRYTERVIKLDQGGVFTYTVRFATAGNKLIQTFGTKDTKIEICSSSGTVLASNDDGGYGTNALKYFYFKSNTTYVIKVKFYSSYTYGTTKLAITPTNGAFSASTLTSYEGISSVTGKTSLSNLMYAYPNCTRVMTFTPSSSGSYTFKTESAIDMYIYVIDPRLSTAITSASYNDDSGEGLNPLLTKTLTAGVPYLVIYCPYNPNALSSMQRLTLIISKN